MKPDGIENKPIITPVGVAKNPTLTKPDTKFLEAGVYGVSLVISADAAKPVIAMIDAEMNAASELAKKDNPRVRVKAADKPYRWVANDADEPTGKVLFTFKMRASGIDRETKQPWERRPPRASAEHAREAGSREVASPRPPAVYGRQPHPDTA